MRTLKNLLAEGKIAAYEYRRDRRDRPPVVVVPGSCAANRVRRRGEVSPFTPGPRLRWLDSHGVGHRKRREALRASDATALRDGFLPRLSRA